MHKLQHCASATHAPLSHNLHSTANHNPVPVNLNMHLGIQINTGFKILQIRLLLFTESKSTLALNISNLCLIFSRANQKLNVKKEVWFVTLLLYSTGWNALVKFIGIATDLTTT